MSQTAEEFREQQLAEARAQNQDGENAVPEQRPQAHLADPNTVSDLTQRLVDEDEIPDPHNAKPMPKSAYDKASSEAQSKKAAKEERKPAVFVGSVIKVTSGPHRDRVGGITRILSYASAEDLVARMAGGADASFSQPKEVEVTFRGDDRDGERVILDLTDVDYDVKPKGFVGRSSVVGSL